MNRTPERAIAAAAVLTHCVIAYTHGGPVAVPDVPAYLSVAQWLWGAELPTPLHYSPGYGFLLAPFGGFAGNDLHTAALIVNGFLAGASVLLAAHLTRMIGGSNRLALCAAGVAFIHPSLSAASRIGWPETALTVLVLLTAILSHKERWFAAGLLGSLSVCFHFRAVVIVFAVLATSLIVRRTRSAIAGTVVGVLVSASAISVTDTWPSKRLTAAQEVASADQLVAVITGQWLALAIGTGGLTALGILIGFRGIRQRAISNATFLLSVSALGMLFLGGWVLAGSDKVDVLLYARYVGPWAVPLAIVGFVCVANRDIRPREVRLGLVMTTIFTLVGLSAQSGLDAPPRRIMTLDSSVLWQLLDERAVFVFLVGAIVVMTSLKAATSGLLVPFAIMALIAIPSALINHNHLQKVGSIADGQSSAAKHLPPGTSCLAHDSTSKTYALWLYRLQLPDIDHRRTDLLSGDQPCSAYVIAAEEGLGACRSARLVATEERAPWSLWEYSLRECG